MCIRDRKTVLKSDGVGGASTRTTATTVSNYGFITLSEIGYDTEYVVSLDNPTLQATTKYRAQALKVVKQGHTTSTFEESNADGDKVGTQHFVGTTGVWEDVEFTVTVNGTTFVDSHTKESVGSGTTASHQYVPKYHSQYTAAVTLQDTGKNVGSNWSNEYQDVTINGVVWRVTIENASTYQSYADSKGAIHTTPKNIKKGEVNIDSVLGGLKSELVAAYGNGGNSTVQNLGLTATVTGTGIYFETTTAFNTIATRGGITNDAIYAFTDTAQNISKLPGQCKDCLLYTSPSPRD